MLHRLLEVFALLHEVNAIKDKEDAHYESRVNEYERLVQVICDDHIAAAYTHIQDQEICRTLKGLIVAECTEILDYRLAAERWHLEIDSRSKDRIISFGEKLSCRFLTALLEDKVTLACGKLRSLTLTSNCREWLLSMWISLISFTLKHREG